MPDRTAVFIDGSNFFKDFEELHIYSYQIEWDRLILDLIGPRDIEYALYYDCPKRAMGDEGPSELQNIADQKRRQGQFFSLLRKIPWMEIRFGRLEKRESKCCGKPHLMEKGVDVQIAADMITGAIDGRFDTAYLISHDGDFSYTIESVRKYGRKCYVATPGESFHLGKVANAFIRLDALRLNSFLRKHGGP